MLWRVLVNGAIGKAIRKNVRPMVPITEPLEENGEISAAALTKAVERKPIPLGGRAAEKPKPPNAPKPNKPSFRAIVQKNKEKEGYECSQIGWEKGGTFSCFWPWSCQDGEEPGTKDTRECQEGLPTL